MKKKALILQNGGSAESIQLVLNNTDWDIEYAFVDAYEELDHICDKRVKNIYVVQGLQMWANERNTCNLTYDDVRKYKKIEADFFDGTFRVINDYNVVKVMFYNALSFWLNVFSKHNFDVIIIQEMTHGTFNDVIPIALAKEKKIPCYQLEPLMFQKYAIYLNNQDEYIQMAYPSKECLEDAMHYSIDPNCGFEKSKSFWKHWIKKMLLKIGGAIFAKSISIILKKRTFDYYICDTLYGKTSIIAMWRSYWVFKMGQKYMRKISKKVSLDDKYIIYYLHFEPEASIQVRCPIKTQLLAIQMLAENLPNGWKLYVKEHPHQQMVNGIRYWDFLATLHHYKTKKFYDYIASMPNTYIVDPDIPSEELTRRAAAISSYHGTVAIESLKYNKPVLLFAGNKSILRYTGAIFSINSSLDCAKAFAEIEAGYNRESVDYNDITSRYLAPNSPNGLELMIKSIYKHYEANFK